MTRLFWFSLFAWMCAAAHGVELAGEPQVEIADRAATLRWKTDVACGTRVSFGIAADKLDQKVDGGVTADHEVVLKDLKAGAVYHYSLGSARQRLFTGSFTIPQGSGPVAPERKSILAKVLDILAPDQKPATKAPNSNAGPRAPPTRETWGRTETLQDHFDRHGADFQSRSPDDYAAQAWHFLQRGRAGEIPMKWDDTDGTLRVFDPQTRAFAAYNRDGTTKTFFRPGNPSYWQRQPGRPIKPSSLPF